MRAMPGVASRGVVRLGPSGPPLAGFAGGLHPVRPGALQEHTVTPGAEMIYDLVTAFDGQGESHYCVGDGQTTFAVTSETPRFATAPRAAAAIMDIMTAAWPAIAQAMQPVPAAQWRQVLDRALRRVAVSLFPAVTGDPTAEAEVMPDGWSTGPHLVASAHGLAAAVMTDGPQAATYDGDRGACLGAIVTAFGTLVRDAVATGWRVFLGTDAAAAPLHAISALSFEVTGDAAPRGDGALTAEMVIGEGPSRAHHVLPAFPSNGQPVFFHQIADVAHVPRLQAKPGAPIALRVVFKDGAGNRLPLHGVTWLPDLTGQVYRRISVPLFDTEGTPLIVGQFLIDVRAASDASRAAETAARAAWTLDKATEFAHFLGRRIGAHLVAEFPAALAAVRT